jgi:hypothetical protein
MIFEKCGLSYCIMTNVPTDPNEARCWRPTSRPCPPYYKTALRIDPFISGDTKAVEFILTASGYENSLEGSRQYIRDWCDVLRPEYVMVSTPHDFVLKEGVLANVKKNSINVEAMKEPGAFSQFQNQRVACDGTDDELPSIINENSDLLCDVLMKVCEERDLPIALKIGVHRGLNPRLKAAGDGIAFADDSMLARLCSRFPRNRFLATFLSRNNQQQACVLALKFSNLHL